MPSPTPMTSAMKTVSAAVKTMTTSMEPVTTAMEPVTTVKAGDEEVYIRANITVRVRTIVRVIIPIIIDREGNTSGQHQGNRYKKQKFFHRAPPLRATFPMFLSFIL